MREIEGHSTAQPACFEDNTRKQLALMVDEFLPHPFATIAARSQLESLLPDYLGMSLAFRYLQAAAQKDAIFEAMQANRGVSEEIELTNAIANFLTWHESGGNEWSSRRRATSHVSDRLQYLHSNALRADAATILGRPVDPNFSPRTREYLEALYSGLGSTDVVRRCAYMVAFELHAAAMIEGLGRSIAAVTAVAHAELKYFDLHIGGSAPAKEEHAELVLQLLGLVPWIKNEEFLLECRTAYHANIEWCRALVEEPSLQQLALNDDVLHRGACHCGKVQFEVRASAVLKGVRCNCSICEKAGFLHLLVSSERFLLLSGDGEMTTYQFNQDIAKHTFCRTCGIKSFYRPRSNPQGFSVNIRCLDRSTIASVEVIEFDGKHWEEQVLHDLPEST